ncbi:DNA-directed RNA polymerase subunit alpha [Halarcobacter anaerophilus]|jgi:DNA-directed RNA polymerase subunit alpha|uniref:DNA-directed RNA polymerase subunit alpha n=1 Tax=Halarcobacter anaerophilus TaxID=877500 RepID=A0A4Q0Y2G7_9BACT|nr:DNA-directed RNA polymerase subunit alpha [Halarcobacter anaerophilus]QDF28654.1 DNA-directed RNA polymerase, alpha subunit [Halarcobacter anaerophilus]RXJ63374.1 DNA-directed RNA polymerase subunit alpha [Halarcobacter anaerophilus]
MKKFADTPFLPTEVEIEAINDDEAKISAYPFESGFAITLAHPLRRLLLSSSVGYAPIAVKIEGASHEFDSLRGMLEDIAIFVINLKNIKFKINGDEEQVVVEYSFDGPKEIKGEDLVNSDVEIVSPDVHLATINSDCNLTFSVIIQRGIGYMPSEDIREMVSADYIPLDAFFTPVKKVVYDIEKMLVEDNPNFEKAVFTVQTNGQITPVAAFKEAVSIMYSQMSVFNKVFDLSEVTVNDSGEEPVELKDLIVKIDDLNLSARSFNSLDRAGLKFLGELVLMSEVEVKNIKNLGKKSFDEISEKLESLGFPIDNTLPENVASALRRKLEQLKA